MNGNLNMGAAFVAGQSTMPPKPKRKKLFISIFIIFFILIASSLVFYFLFPGLHKARLPYLETYRLVPEKISQSASIRINLPPGIDAEYAKGNVKFSPTIEGKWAEARNFTFWSWLKNLNTASAADSSQNSKTIFYQPKEPLALNRYYSVELADLKGGAIKADFLAVEDPEITAIFPKKNSETPEDSEITIVFNRPMVPLTSLGILEKKDVPVVIEPATEGRFKWITTSNLQFIPTDRLQRSSNYTVRIKTGFISMDGLSLPSQESYFYTRKLRYVNLTEGDVAYNQPISIHFNQPVDLDKTKKEIVVIDNATGKSVPFIAEYKNRSKTSSLGQEIAPNLGLFDFFSQAAASLTLNTSDVASDKEGIDKSVIQIYNQQDKFGRKKLWNFSNDYTLKISQAYPTEGDILLKESREVNFFVPDVIKNITAESTKTSYASIDFFDPQGKLWVQFYEDINLERSDIRISKLQEIGYGEKCKETGEDFSSNVSCEKIADKSKIFIILKNQDINPGDSVEIDFEKIINADGLQINRTPIKNTIRIYPKFEILNVFPASGSNDASLTDLTICSNSPILVPEPADYSHYLKIDLDNEINYWSSSWQVDYISEDTKCNYGEFRTQIGYGLMPLSHYNLELKLRDVFSQDQDKFVNFNTGTMPASYLNFYQFQQSYVISSPNKTKLTFAAENMDYINVDICKLEANNFLYYLSNPLDCFDPVVAHCQQIVDSTIPLPKRYWLKNYFYFDVKDYFADPLGHYIITFSHPDYKLQIWQNGKYVYQQVFERTLLSVTNLAVAEKKIDPALLSDQQLKNLNNMYWVTDISTLEPKTGAMVTFYQGDNMAAAGSYYTNAQGIATTDVIEDLKGVIVRQGKDSTVIPSWESKLNWANSLYPEQKTYLYTDKAIYQPTQTVFLKGIYRTGLDGNYEFEQNKLINLQVFNAKDDEIFNQDLKINDFGTFEAKIVLEKDSPLGMYRICVDASYDCSFFDVQEYVAAPFETNVSTDKEEYVSKDTAQINIDANYYFGVPLEGGTVSYTLSSQTYYFDRYTDGYFNFGSSWYYWPPYYYGDMFILRGETTLSSDGKAKISQALDFEKLFKNESDRTSRIFVLDVTVTNPQGQSISSQKSFIAHAGEFYLGLKPDKSFVSKNEKFNLNVKAVDTQGKEKMVSDITLGIYKITWIHSKRQEADGGYSYKWEKQRALINEYHFSTDGSGNYSKELSIDQEGEFEAEIRAKDSRGNVIKSVDNIYVYGSTAVTLSPVADTELELEATKTDWNVGDTAQVVIKSPYKKAKAFIAIERGKVFNYEIVDVVGNFYQYNFPIKEEYLPNIYISVLLQSNEPQVRFGQISFSVGAQSKNLDITVLPNKRNYLPGEEVVLDISVKDNKGQAVQTELSVSVVDLSVLALKGNPKKNPLIFFYGGFPLAVTTSSNIKNILMEIKVPTKGGSGGGSEAAPADQELARRIRGEFRETAFWQAVVQTGNDGKAQVKFSLPDNLTTWQTEALGITKDTKVGVNYQEFVSRKELMIVPLRPRFIVPGDIFYIGAKVFNQSAGKQSLSVKFTSNTLTLKDEAIKNITLKPEGNDTVYFKVLAPENIEEGTHNFSLSAKNQNLEDTVVQSIDIAPTDFYEATATANYTQANNVKEYVFLPDNIIEDKGSLEIKSSATLAVFLSDALNYLLGYPYRCAEQISSQLNAIAIVKKGLNLPNLEDKFKLEKIKYQGKEYSIDEIMTIGLSELYNDQQMDGGFSFWRSGTSNFYLTLQVVEALSNLQSAGININQSVLDKAVNYLNQEFTNKQYLYQNKETIILTAYTLSKVPSSALSPYLKAKIAALVNDELFINDQISNTSLAYLAILLTKDFDQQLENKIFQTLDNRINIDSRGAFLEPNHNRFWNYFETTTKDTALYLKALSIAKIDNQILDKIVRWLLSSKAKDGSWGSTNNTLAVVDAFTDFLKWRRETESNFDLQVFVDQKIQGEFKFEPQTILEQFSKSLPLSALKLNENNVIEFQKANQNTLPNNLYYDLSLKYYLPIEQIPPRDEGFGITRSVYQLDDKANKNPINKAKVGQVLRVHLQIIAPKTRNFVMVEDFIPAGMEIVNLDLATEQKSLRLQEQEIQGRELPVDFKELHDDRAFLYAEKLNSGVYEYDYFVRALIKGQFSYLPATASEMYFPENFGRTDASHFIIE